MMIKIFTPNENGKIELTKEEIESLLKEAYEEGKSSLVHFVPYNTGFGGGDVPVISCDKDWFSTGTPPYKDCTTISNKLDSQTNSESGFVRNTMVGVQ